MTKTEKDYFHNIESNVSILSIGLNDVGAWDDALRGIAHSVFQTRSYCEAIQKSQTNPIEMLSIRSKDSGLIAIYLKRSKDNAYFDIYSPYGFGGILIWGSDHQIINESFEAWMRKNNIITAFLMSHPVFDAARDDQFVSQRSSYVLDLSLNEEDLWLNMGSSHTSELKKLFKDTKISITDNKEELLKVFPVLYQNTLARVGAGSAYFFSTETLNALVHDSHTLILGGKVGDTIHAVVMINYSKECGEYFINATDWEGRNLTRLLLWEGIKRLRSLQVPKFNLGGGATEGDQLEAFKKRFGGKQVRIPLYRKIVDMDQYNRLCSVYNKSSDDLTYFPPYWKN